MTDTPLGLLLSRLPEAKRSGNGYSPRCPAHDDQQPSLPIAEGENGGALVHCHAGCAPEDIVAAIDLDMADLMPSDTNGTHASAKLHGRKDKRPCQREKSHNRQPRAFCTAEAARSELECRYGKPSAQWTYHSVEGEPVGMIIR